MGRGRISNLEKQKQAQQESMNKFGCVLNATSAIGKVQELKEQISHLESQIENCENEIRALEEELINEKKVQAIQLLQELPNYMIDEIINSVKSQEKTMESESSKE